MKLATSVVPLKSIAAETSDREFASRQEACTSSRDGKDVCRDQGAWSRPKASTSALQGAVSGTDGGCLFLTGAPSTSQHRGWERRDGDEPITHQVSSSALQANDSICSRKNSLQDEGRRKRLRYVPNWSNALKRSLPPTEVPRCHNNAKDWPALGDNESRKVGDEVHCKYDASVFRAKPRFRALDLRSSRPRKEDDLRQDSFGEDNAARGLGKVKEEVKGEAKLMMFNRDFTVTSPVRENLLVTIALTSQRNTSASGEEEDLEQAVKQPLKPVQILIGKFTAFSSFLRFDLCRDALRVKFEQNAGGSSTISESLSVEYFARRFQAQDVVTEMEVEYWSSSWKKVDYICTLYGQRVGVSVTRAMCYPDPNAFSPEIAYHLLHKKLYGLVVARDGVSKRHSFCKCILHVWCETQRTAEIMKTMYAGVRKELQISDDVIMVLTVADGLHARPIFYEHALENT
ncbi:hypothetical protein KC19_3G189300 [Ceratodon purpureus]|uniref:Uncharacterized protein n=1 Tax=Ceratodon purpureus TaxID=3225 RepID=A0A8T0IMH2_CERPU|nr:hypothetical protein KC19_3G189300 [Ceratodon purpureus]